MAQIRLITPADIQTGQSLLFDYAGSVGEFIVDAYYEDRRPLLIFDGEPCMANRIQPEEIDRLMNGHGSYTIIETPGSGLEVPTILAIVAIVVSVAAVLLTPKPKLPDNVNRRQQSPNNSLSSRSNVARPLERIPDICGRVLAIPDIIQPPYYRYSDATGERMEYAYYCVGRTRAVVTNVRDGDTPISAISRASAQVYYPGNSPNNSSPDIQIGEFIDTEIISAYRSNEVNGIDLPGIGESGLEPIIATAYKLDGPFIGAPPYYSILAIPASNVIWLAKINELGAWLSSEYIVGANIFLGNFVQNFIYPSTDIETIDYTGTYEIAAISSFNYFSTKVYAIEVVETLSAPTPGYSYEFLESIGEAYIRTTTGTPFFDWYYMTRENFSSGFVNLAAPNGIFRDDGGASYDAITIDFEVQVETLTGGNLPTGVVQTLTPSITGDQNIAKGLTVDFTLTTPSKFRVRCKRTTAKFAVAGVVFSDRVILQDVYGVVPVDETDFGDVTTIQTRTIENPSATSAKERRLNCTATESLFRYTGSGDFEGSKSINVDDDGNSSAVQSFIRLALDEYVGGRSLAEIDADGLLLMENEINAYFGKTDCSGFDYTFDSTDITFQEAAQYIFNAINCIAYREGTIISALFERPQTVPTMLFTHRSKKPDSESYTRNFNSATISEGVEFRWVERNTNETKTITLPAGAINTTTFDIPGIRNEIQATIRANRELNKIRNRKETLQVTVTAEGRFIRPNDMVRVVKGTRVQTYDGEVMSQAGLTLTLSQPVAFTPGDGHSITLKDEFGQCENIVCTAGSTAYEVVLASAPSQTIRTGIESRRTEFSFAADGAQAGQLWLVQQIDNRDKYFVQLQAVNYSDAYYSGDLTSTNAFSDGFSSGFS